MDGSRRKKLALNSISSLTNQVVTLICGFILPKLILNNFGSEVNGLVTSINQFLSLITFLDLGVGTVVTSSLYGPLAKKDKTEISKIYVSAKKFFRRIAEIYLGYLVVVIIVYPNFIADQFEFWYTASLILAISVTLFAQYYFGIVYQLLLNADQKSYVQLNTQSLTLILNTVACAILMKFGASIQAVKFTTSLVFLLRPIILSIYVRKHYEIDTKIKLQGEPIKQKWNGLAQHLSYVVLSNTDTVVLSTFSTLTNVSIYGVYSLVVTGLKNVCNSLTAGVAALFGNMLANNEKDLLNSTFDYIEWLMHTVVTLLFTMCGILIVPFVKVYTIGITDTDYIVPMFALLITLAQGAYCIRLPYNMMVLAAGHYKQTQLSSVIEMLLNIVISIALVMRFGLVGVAIGTFVSMTYRTCYLAWYLSKNITNRNIMIFIKHLLVDILIISLVVFATKWIELEEISYIGWIVMAIKTALLSVPIVILVNWIFYKEQMRKIVRKVWNKK